MNMNSANAKSLFIGLFIPFLAVLTGIGLLSQSQFLVFGIPAAYFWLFLWFVLTSVCLAISWYCFDRHRYEDEAASNEES